MTAERPDRGARALAERLHEQKLDCTVLCDQYRAGLDGANELSAERTLAALRRQHAFDADAILANGAVFLPDAAELDRLRLIEAAARPYMAAWDGMRAEARKLGIWAESDEVIYDSPKAAALRAALEPEGSAQG